MKKNLRERKYQKRENFEDDGSSKLGIIITNSFIDQYKSRVHPRQRASKFELSVFIYSFVYGFTCKLAQIVYTFSISSFFSIFYVRRRISLRQQQKSRRDAKINPDKLLSCPPISQLICDLKSLLIQKKLSILGT